VFLTALAAGTVSALTGCRPGAATLGARASRSADVIPASVAVAPLDAAATQRPGRLTLPAQTAGNSKPPRPADAPVPGQAHPFDRLSGGSRRLALTVDDGTSTEVLDAYVDFVIASGIRLTFFPNGVYPGWKTVRRKLAPLVESGQVQLGNHTFEHPDVTRLSDTRVADQLERNETFLRNEYGVSGRPFFRPPYGSHNARTDRISGDLGFTRTVLWWGSLGDSAILTGEQILAEAQIWFQPERVVIGHANHPGVTHVYGELIDLIKQRNLQTVTLRDVFGDLPLEAQLASS
jgi:peptidoglycan/xylan/chitin deacetylase (PgdA/CDA1 family)